jgi:hypothetical protein
MNGQLDQAGTVFCDRSQVVHRYTGSILVIDPFYCEFHLLEIRDHTVSQVVG